MYSACFSLCGHQRELGAHRGPMLSNRDCAKRQAEMGMGAPATISHGRRRSKLRDRHQPSDFRTRSDKRDGDSSPMASSKAPELRDRGRVICLALPQFPDVHKYRGVLPVFGRFSSTGGAWRGSSALRGKQTRGMQSIRPGQRNPIARRFPFTRARTTQVDENRPISGRSPP